TPVPTVSTYTAPTKEQYLESLKSSVVPGSGVTEETRPELADQLLSMATQPGAFDGLKPLVDQMANPASRRQYLLQRHLPHIKAPILWIFGTGDTMDPLPTWRDEYEKVQGDMSKSSKPWVTPNSKYLLVQGGHNCHWEQPAKIAGYITDFLLEEKVPAPAAAARA